MMLKLYIISKWLFVLFILVPIVFIIPASCIQPMIPEANKEFIFFGLIFVYYYFVKKLMKEKYHFKHSKNLTKEFRNATLYIYLSYFVTLVTYLTVIKIQVLAFFAGPVIILTIGLLLHGLSSANKELLSKNVKVPMKINIGFIEVFYILTTILLVIYENLR